MPLTRINGDMTSLHNTIVELTERAATVDKNSEEGRDLAKTLFTTVAEYDAVRLALGLSPLPGLPRLGTAAPAPDTSVASSFEPAVPRG